MMQITNTTDGKFVGLVFDAEQPIELGGSLFVPTNVVRVSPTEFRFFNSSYVIDVQEI